MRLVRRIFRDTTHRQCQYKRNTAAVVAEKQEVIHTQCVCVCVCVLLASVIQQAKRKPHTALSFEACLAYRIFPHYLINGTIFEKNYQT